jgi:4-hydroxybenzoate polyprenyltransferase
MIFGKTLLQILVTSRPVGWVIFWISYLAGFLVSDQSFDGQNLVFLIILGPVLSFPIYVFNDIYDFESDQINTRKKYKIMGGILDKKYWNLFIKLSCLCIFTVILTPLFFQSLFSFFLIILGLIIGIGYSVPPLRLKTKIGGDVLANTLGFIVLFCLGAGNIFVVVNHSRYLIYSSFMVASWSFLFSSIDYKPDKFAKDITTATKISHQNALVISAFGYFISALTINFLFAIKLVSLVLGFCSFLIIVAILIKNEKNLLNYLIFLSIFVTFLSIIAYCWIYLPFFERLF